MSFIAELKRRNVFRAAFAYLAFAWLLTEAAGTLFPAFGIPDWGIRFVVIVFALGFIPALAFSWVYEITPTGLKREQEVSREDSITRLTATRLDRITIGLVLVAFAFVLVDRVWLQSADSDDASTEVSETIAPPDTITEAPAPPTSIAVLAFTNTSPDADQEYFADGLSDTLIHVLAQVSGLKVTAKTSSFYFKGKDVTIAEIAGKLEVAHVLEGSIQKAGDRIRVIAQLVKVSDRSPIWSKNFDRDLEDIFAVQDEIAREVVLALKISLLDTEQQRLAQRYQPTLEAYGEMILGRQAMVKRTADSLAASERHFKLAIELDPDYALAYVGLADTYLMQQEHSGLSLEASLQRRQPLIEKALKLDPLSGEAYAARALVRVNQQQLEAAEDDFLRAIALNPNYAPAHQWYVHVLIRQDRFEEGLVQIRKAVELDPMSPTLQGNLAVSVWNLGRAEESLALVRRNIERNPEFPGHYDHMGQFLSMLGRVGQAQPWFEEARTRNPGKANIWQRKCLGLLNLGDAISAAQCTDQFSAIHPQKAAFTRAAQFAYHQQWAAVVATLEAVLEQQPGNRFHTRQLANVIAGQGDIVGARRLMADAFPELLQDDPELTVFDLDSALIFAGILHSGGELERRDVLLQAIEQRIETMHRTRGVPSGILDVYIHTLRGDHDQAIAALRDAIDVGWRLTEFPNFAFWWQLRYDWRLKSLHQYSEFNDLLNALETDIQEQRRWYEAHKSPRQSGT